MMNETLKLKRPYMHGSAVKRLQELGDMLGYDYGPNDGIFGEDTEHMVADYQRDNGLVIDGVCGPVTWMRMLAMVDAVAPDITGKVHESYPRTYDIRGKHPRPKHYARKRRWSDIVGVTLHQTGCGMPKSPAAWERLNAHIGITQEGLVVLVNDPTDMIWHAQGLSKDTIGIEIEGNFHGVKDVERTLWKGGGGPYYLNPAMLEAAEELLLWLRAEFMHQEADWNHIYAHRQSSDTRRGDPGSQIWSEIAMPWAEKIGLAEDYDGGQHYYRGKGKPIPQLWNPQRINKY